MELVADTNIFLAVALNEPEKDRLIRATEGLRLTAPEILHYEVGNALTSLLKRGLVQSDDLPRVWRTVKKIPVSLRICNIESALRLAARLGLYAYDAYFLDCALRGDSPLLTLDRRLQRAAAEVGVELLEIEE